MTHRNLFSEAERPGIVVDEVYKRLPSVGPLSTSGGSGTTHPVSGEWDNKANNGDDNTGIGPIRVPTSDDGRWEAGFLETLILRTQGPLTGDPSHRTVPGSLLTSLRVVPDPPDSGQPENGTDSRGNGTPETVL